MVAHEVEVLGVYLAGNLQILHFFIVLANGGDGVFQFAGSGIHHDIFLCRGVVAYEVAFPFADARRHKRQLILAADFLLVHLDTEVHHIARLVFKGSWLGEFEWRSADGDAEERRSGGYGLRHHDGAPLVAGARRYRGCILHIARHANSAVGKVDACLACHVWHEHYLLRVCPFLGGEARTLYQCDTGVRHAV